MGVVAPGLDIDAKGTAIKIVENALPQVFGAPNTGTIPNGGLSSEGGFSDLITGQDKEAHQYAFTFAPGTTVSKFSLHMLDFGDLNPSNASNHYVSMTAYNASSVVVGKAELSYTTNSGLVSAQYGNLNITGDAITASPGQPGNWTWEVSGDSIVKVVLNFGVGFDPNIGFDTLNYCPQSP